MRKLLDILKKNEKLVLFNRCRLYCKEADFRDLVIRGYHNPSVLEIVQKGNDYKGEIIYMADETGCGVGFFAELGMTLIKLHFADDRGLTPFVYWGSNYVYYEPNGINGEKNAFLHYFEPVSHIESVENANFVVYQKPWHCNQVKSIYNAVSDDVSQEYVDAMARMLKKYIKYNELTEAY